MTIDSIEDVTIETAKIALATVMRNLVGNAVAHHDQPDNIRIEISAKRRKDVVEF